MRSDSHGVIEALAPRGLIINVPDFRSSLINQEGLCPIRVSWEEGTVVNIEFIDWSEESSRKILLPRLLEPHAHIDKSFTWNEFPNLEATYEGALKANYKEHKYRTPLKVQARAEKALSMALNNGIRAIRSHVDSLCNESDLTWETLSELKMKWKNLIELQLVALVPIEFWSSNKGELFAKKVARSGGIMGGVLVPPFNSIKVRDSLLSMLKLANKLGCSIDIHIDESDTNPAAGLINLIKALDDIRVSVQITCSHVSSMGLLPSNHLMSLADDLARHEINVVALPITNSWILGRKNGVTPVVRPIAPILQLQQAGVTVAIGGDNVQDPWFPGGEYDPVALIASSLSIIQLAPWQRLGLAPFTTACAKLMQLEWDGTFGIGAPADFLSLSCKSWNEALSIKPNREVYVNGISIG